MADNHRYNHFVIFVSILIVGLGLALALPWLAKAQGFAAKSEAGVPDNAPKDTRFYVAITGTGVGGTNWATAFKYLQDALAAAADPTIHPIEIWVAKGVYYPDVGLGQINNDQDSTFVMTDGVELYGGFKFNDANFTDRDWVNNKTVLSGDIDGDDKHTKGVVLTTTDIVDDNAYHVVTAHGVTGTAVLDGFTITAGQANGGNAPNTYGGGFYCDGSGINNKCNPSLSNIKFSGNKAKHYGGAMFNRGTGIESSPSLTNVTFSGNSATQGGAMYNYSGFGESSPILNNVTFSGNSASEQGGAMFNNGVSGESSPILTNVAFSGNSSKYGGAMYNFGESGASSPILTNVTFSGNSVTIGGGAMFNFGEGGASSPEVYNSILWNNQTNSVTGTVSANIYNYYATITFTHSLVEGSNGSGPNWIGGTYKNGGGNIDMDPLFVEPISPSSAPTTIGDLRLGVGSPAIDAGLNFHTENTGVLTDLDGETRFKDGDGDGTPTVDMGAYETAALYLLTVIKSGSGDGRVTSSPEGIDCGDTCSVLLEEDSGISLMAAADEDSIFTGWSGDCSDSGDCELTIDAAKNMIANFETALKVPLPIIFR